MTDHVLTFRADRDENGNETASLDHYYHAVGWPKHVAVRNLALFLQAEHPDVWASARDVLESYTLPPSSEVEVGVLTMRLSGDRKEHYVRISKDGRTYETNRYEDQFLNRARYEADMLSYVLCGTSKPNLADPKYADL